MTDRVATPPPRIVRSPAVRLSLALWILAGSGVVTASQPPVAAALDDRSPRPPGERSIGARKYIIPNKDRAIFQGHRDPATGRVSGGIIDFEPIARESSNKLEYDAWHEVTLHAAQFSARELEEHAGRDATRDELTGKTIPLYRLDLLGFDGKLTKARRFPASMSLQKSGTLEMYEALLVPLDEPPTRTISVVFTELPEGLAAVKKAPEEEWVPIDRWAVAAGYFFKAMQEAPGADAVPVLIGKSVRFLDAPPAGPDLKNPAAIDKNLRIFRSIRNDAPAASGDENWEEVLAWDRVLLHARRFKPEELEELARTDLSFFDLFNDGRWVDKDGKVRYDGKRDHKLELVRFEGRLVKLDRMPPSRALREAGVESGYEGWLVPRNEPSGNPVCIVFTDPIEGIEANGHVNAWVSFAGYAFKLLQYESGEKDREDPRRNTWKRAPLLLGRAAIVRPDPDGAATVSWSSFFTIATAVVLGLIAAALGLGWWYRRGDRTARREIEAGRTRNPFDEVSS